MWPCQRLSVGGEPSPELTQSVGEILHLGREITTSGFILRKFMVFPIFMAGIATRSPVDQHLALKMLSMLEHKSIGKVMTATRQILEIVYERQREVIMQGGHPLIVDWIDLVAERGLQMIDARL